MWHSKWEKDGRGDSVPMAAVDARSLVPVSDEIGGVVTIWVAVPPTTCSTVSGSPPCRSQSTLAHRVSARAKSYRLRKGVWRILVGYERAN